jgi:hypothetical protein
MASQKVYNFFSLLSKVICVRYYLKCNKQSKNEQETIKQQGYNKKFKVSAHGNVFITSGNNALHIITLYIS